MNEHNLKNTTKGGKVTTEPSSTTGRSVFWDMGFVQRKERLVSPMLNLGKKGQRVKQCN
jgi:hypothetical protein